MSPADKFYFTLNKTICRDMLDYTYRMRLKEGNLQNMKSSEKETLLRGKNWPETQGLYPVKNISFTTRQMSN